METILSMAQTGSIAVFLLLMIDIGTWGSSKAPQWYSAPAGFIFLTTFTLWILYTVMYVWSRL